jgi:carbonic anhydrase
MQKLVQGIHRFRQSSFRPMQGLFEQLAAGQHPETLMITCSDSRVVPNLITQTDPGELFILRNAGNLVPPHGAGTGGEAATIEFAVASLGVRDVIICGHSHCGAMSSLLHPGDLAALPAMASWLKHAEKTRRIIGENYAHLEGDALLTAATEENVLVQLEHLKTLPAVADRLAKGDLKVHGWVYKIETGEVFAYDPASGQFLTLAEFPADIPPPRRRATGI